MPSHLRLCLRTSQFTYLLFFLCKKYANQKTGLGALFARFRAERQMQKHKFVQKSHSTEGVSYFDAFYGIASRPGGLSYGKNLKRLHFIVARGPVPRDLATAPRPVARGPVPRDLATSPPSPSHPKDASGYSQRRGAECPLQTKVHLNSPPE